MATINGNKDMNGTGMRSVPNPPPHPDSSATSAYDPMQPHCSLGGGAGVTEDSAFLNVLSVSDLDRDEAHFRQHWSSYLPLDNFNFSLTARENSRINPPNFMPAEDSLFQELKPSEELNLSTHKMKSSSSSDISSCAMPEKKEPNRSTLGVPSIHEIQEALRNCPPGASPQQLLEAVLNADENRRYGHDGSPLSSDETVSTVSAGEFSSGTSTEQDWLVNELLSVENSIIFGCVDIRGTKTKALHLLRVRPYDLSVKYDKNYLLKLTGNSAFQLMGSHIVRGQQRLSVPGETWKIKEDWTDVWICFRPTNCGPANAEVTIECGYCHKIVKLSGFGGRSLFFMQDIGRLRPRELGMAPALVFNSEFKAQLCLENLGTAAAYFFIDFGDLQWVCSTTGSCHGVINTSANRRVEISLSSDRRKLEQIVDFLSTSDMVAIGSLSVYYGDEPTRQRLKRLSRFPSQLKLTKLIEKEYPFLFRDYEEVPCDLEEMADSPANIPFLCREGIHRCELPVQLHKEVLFNLFSRA